MAEHEPAGIGGHERALEAVGPFHQQDAAAGQVFIPADADGLLRALHAVEIEVRHGQGAVIMLVHQGESGAGGRVAGAQPFQYPLHQVGLARPQVTHQAENLPGFQFGCHAAPKRYHPGLRCDLNRRIFKNFLQIFHFSVKFFFTNALACL